jgi:nucleoside 2-deoxyribosyltransferase
MELTDKKVSEISEQHFKEGWNAAERTNLVYCRLADRGDERDVYDSLRNVGQKSYYKPISLIDVNRSVSVVYGGLKYNLILGNNSEKIGYRFYNLGGLAAKNIDARIRERVRTGFMRRTTAVDSDSNDFDGTVFNPAAAPGSDGSFRNSPARFCTNFTVEEKQFKTGYFDGSWLTLFSSDGYDAYTVRVKKSTTGEPDAKDGTANRLIIETYTYGEKYKYMDTDVDYNRLQFIPEDGTKFKITRIQNDGFANLPLTAEVLKKALKDLKSTGASPMSDGYWICIIDQEMELDFMLDPRWKDADTYRQKYTKLYTGEIGMWSNIRFVRADIPRENKNGDYDPDGAYRLATLLGHQSFKAAILEPNQPIKNICSDPRTLNNKYVLWELYFASSIISAARGCNIICGISSGKSTAPNSKSVFMAMKFDEEQKGFIRENVDSVVKEFGLDLKLLSDISTRENIIDVKMRNEIKKSRLLICDLTHRNNGAYFEAGYAEGLGNPVIYICEQKTFGEGKLHFDVEHQDIYMWKNGDEESIKKFKEDLKAKIKAVLSISN